jgi:hypothetical protein
LECRYYTNAADHERQVLKISENLIIPSGQKLWAQDLQTIIYEHGVVTNTGRTVKEILHSLSLAQSGLSLFDAALDAPGNLRRKFSDRINDELDERADFRSKNPASQIALFNAAQNLVETGIYHYLFA